MELTLSQQEAQLLDRILKGFLPELREEVHKTDAANWREALKGEEAVLKSLIARLDAVRAGAEASTGP